MDARMYAASEVREIEMKEPSDSPKSIDEYIGGFPAEVREVLGQVRAAIRRAAPEATEAIAYRIPTFVLNGNLVHLAAFKNHIGFYPTPSGIEAFRDELSGYRSAKGSAYAFGMVPARIRTDASQRKDEKAWADYLAMDFEKLAENAVAGVSSLERWSAVSRLWESMLPAVWI